MCTCAPWIPCEALTSRPLHLLLPPPSPPALLSSSPAHHPSSVSSSTMSSASAQPDGCLQEGRCRHTCGCTRYKRVCEHFTGTSVQIYEHERIGHALCCSTCPAWPALQKGKAAELRRKTQRGQQQQRTQETAQPAQSLTPALSLATSSAAIIVQQPQQHQRRCSCSCSIHRHRPAAAAAPAPLQLFLFHPPLRRQPQPRCQQPPALPSSLVQSRRLRHRRPSLLPLPTSVLPSLRLSSSPLLLLLRLLPCPTSCWQPTSRCVLKWRSCMDRWARCSRRWTRPTGMCRSYSNRWRRRTGRWRSCRDR